MRLTNVSYLYLSVLFTLNLVKNEALNLEDSKQSELNELNELKNQDINDEASHILARALSFGMSITMSPTQPPTNPPTRPPTNPPTRPPTNPPTRPPTIPQARPQTNPPTRPPTNPSPRPPTNPPTRPPTRTPTQRPESPPTPTVVVPTTNPPTRTLPTIVDLAVANDDFSTLVGLLGAAGLVDTLAGEGPFTVFAPTNEAFDKLPADVVATLTDPDNVEDLVNVLTYHVVGGTVILSTDLTEGAMVGALNGETLTVTSLDPPTINESVVIQADILASNGVVHVIETVLIPPPTPPPTRPPTSPITNPPTAPLRSPTNPPFDIPKTPTRSPTSPFINPATIAPISPPTNPPFPIVSPPTNPPFPIINPETNPPTKAQTNPPNPLPTNPPTIPPTMLRTNPPTSPPTNPVTNPQTPPPTNAPVAPPSNPPTNQPVPPVTPSRDFRAILDPVALQGGQEFSDPTSYQSQALAWLEGNDFSQTASEEQVIQRYALASIYYSTNGIRTPATDLILGEGAIPPGWISSTNWLTGDECSTAAPWFGITCQNGGVTQIVLASNRITGTFAPEAQLLRDSLTRIDLFRNPVYNSGDVGNAFLGELTNLRELYYGQTNFEYNGIPSHIGRLTNLREYDASFTLYFGPLEGSTFAPLQNLEYLVLSGNAYNSSIPIEIGQLPNLQFFYAQFAFVEGDLSFMRPMRRIVELWIDQNPGLGGTLPTFLGELSTLRSFSITRNSFSGPIPTEIGNMSELVRLWMYDNMLTGTVPTELGNLARLETLEIEENMIGGVMPPEICANRSPPQGFGLLSILEADCGGSPPEIECSCCTCCVGCVPAV